MTQVNTDYINLGPEVKALTALKVNEFFQFPEDGCVYRVIHKGTEDALCLDLTDLRASIFKLDMDVEPREVNKIDIKVELL